MFINDLKKTEKRMYNSELKSYTLDIEKIISQPICLPIQKPFRNSIVFFIQMNLNKDDVNYGEISIKLARKRAIAQAEIKDLTSIKITYAENEYILNEFVKVKTVREDTKYKLSVKLINREIDLLYYESDLTPFTIWDGHREHKLKRDNSIFSLYSPFDEQLTEIIKS